MINGALQDGFRFEAGDFGHMAPGTRHELSVSPESPCACLVASQAPLRWLSTGGRAAGLVMRI